MTKGTTGMEIATSDTWPSFREPGIQQPNLECLKIHVKYEHKRSKFTKDKGATDRSFPTLCPFPSRALCRVCEIVRGGHYRIPRLHKRDTTYFCRMCSAIFPVQEGLVPNRVCSQWLHKKRGLCNSPRAHTTSDTTDSTSFPSKASCASLPGQVL